VSFSRAVFNRAQVALSIIVAGTVFHALAGGLEPWTRAIGSTAVALSLQYVEGRVGRRHFLVLDNQASS
jgi:hypothetical protein